MKVCLISSEYPTDNHGGGIGTYTEKTARSLAKVGIDVTVITETVDAPSRRVEEGVHVIRLARTTLPRLRTVARARAVDRAVAALVPRPDIVQACEFGAEAALLSLRRRRGTRLVTRLATPSFMVRELNAHGTGAGSIGRSQIEGLERLQTSRSDGIISISRAITEVVASRWKISPSAITLIRTGVDFADRYGHVASPLPAALENRPYILFYGRLEERKGVHVLAEALPSVLDLHPDVDVVFAGNVEEFRGSPMAEYVRHHNRRSLERLHFYPRLPQRELYPLIEHARLVVLPSLWEGLGNVALEAIDMAKPVVATSGSGFDDVIEDGRSGLLVLPGDVDALREALLSLLGDEAGRLRLAEGAKTRARAFALPTVTHDLVGYYDRLLSEPRRNSERTASIESTPAA